MRIFSSKLQGLQRWLGLSAVKDDPQQLGHTGALPEKAEDSLTASAHPTTSASDNEPALTRVERIDAINAAFASDDPKKAVELAGSLDMENVWVIKWATQFHDLSPEERAICATAFNKIVVTPESVVSMARAVRYIIDAGIPGAVVECGVYLGGSTMALMRSLMLYGDTNRDIYLFDTFEGMPQPTKEDGPIKEALWNRLKRPDGTSDIVRCDIDEVRNNVLAVGYPSDRIYFIKGMVEDTIPRHAPEKIAILRLDTDWYTSTKHELEQLYDRIAPGGILIIDDYGAMVGCKTAVDEFFAARGMTVFLNRIDPHARLLVKPL